MLRRFLEYSDRIRNQICSGLGNLLLFAVISWHPEKLFEVIPVSFSFILAV